MDWDLVRLFVDVVDAGSMSEAARRRGVTRSGISQRLKHLERQVSAQLLRRTTRDLRLTDIGTTLYEHGKRIALEFEAAQFDVASMGRTLSGLVRVRLPPGIGQRYLAPALMDFARANPEITFRVMFDNRFSNLIGADIDIAITIADEPPQDVVCKDLGAVRWQLYCTPRYRDSLARLETPADLGRAAFLSLEHGRRIDLALVAGEKRARVALKPRFSSENVHFLQSCALADMGVALLPNYMARDLALSGALVKVLPDYSSEAMAGRLFMLTVPNRFPTPAAQAVMDLLRRAASRVLADSNADLAATARKRPG